MKACPVCALELEDSYLFCPEDGSSMAVTGGDGSSAQIVVTEPDDETSNAVAVTSRAIETQHLPAFLSGAHEPAQHGFRIAAIATMIALAVFALVGLYALVSNLSRRPSPVARTASQTEPVEPVPFVVIPREALDYKEEQPAASASEKLAELPATARIVEHERKEILSSSNEQRDRKTNRSVPPLPAQITPVSAAASQTPGSPAPVSPHVNSSEFDSRLVRSRASRTSSGYRYDLTFNMQEQRGHSAQWQRVLITTRSASGTNHTQAIPFVHRLGGTGALTFTISVELTGRSEADWRGRINCTTLGWDNAGAPLQASFVANVTP